MTLNKEETVMEQPNILIIMCDQMVASLTGAYGHPVVQTPNLNRLVDEGVRFDNAYSPCPICAPTRASLQTGKYVSRIGAYDNSSVLPSDQPSFCHYLSVAGYDTAATGKLHFIGPDQLHGFEKRLTTDIFPSDFEFLTQRLKEGLGDYSQIHEQPIAIDYVTAGVHQWSMGFDYDEEAHFRALEYLRGKRSLYTGTLQKPLPARDERPFCLMVSYSYPHEPFHVTQELWDLYEGADIELPEVPFDLAEREHPMDKMLNIFHGTHRVDLNDEEALYNMRRAYYGLVTYIDRKVGELLQALEDYGLRDNTLVMFLSDHGDMLGERRMVQKRTFYEHSSRVPLIVSYPRRWKGGIVVKEPVSIVDIMPTVIEFAGVDEDVLPIDGKSVIPMIEGQRDPERVVFSELHCEGVNTTCFMVRQGDFKYIHVTGHTPQLYNLVDDPKEWSNLVGDPEHAEVERRMHELLMASFDPEQIEQDVQESMARRRLIRRAMKITGTKWDYQPFFDATEQYWREG
jgi:choline-sulfatase